MRVECDLFDRWASLYRDYRLPGRARTAVERHLGYCHTCAARYEAYTSVLDTARTPAPPSTLIAADVAHEIPPAGWIGRRRRVAAGFLVWLLGLVLLVGLLAAAFVLGYRTGARRPRPAPREDRTAAPKRYELRAPAPASWKPGPPSAVRGATT